VAGKIRVLFLLGFLFVILSGCTQDGTSASDTEKVNSLSCWVTMEESSLNQVHLRVLLEDANGNVPTGARVLLKTPANELSWVYFTASSNIYESTLSSLTSGSYSVSVNSAAGNDTVVIPMVMLNGSPDINTLQDATGVVAGLGQSLNASSAISVEWKTPAGASVYKGTISCGAVTSYVFSSLANTVIIPPDTLLPGKTYSISIEAQYIGGDPYLQEQHYYAFSYSQSPDYYFTLQ
jgi:hypothetical protein